MGKYTKRFVSLFICPFFDRFSTKNLVPLRPVPLRAPQYSVNFRILRYLNCFNLWETLDIWREQVEPFSLRFSENCIIWFVSAMSEHEKVPREFSNFITRCKNENQIFFLEKIGLKKNLSKQIKK